MKRNGHRGEIRIVLRRKADGEIEMAAEENGEGVPEGLDLLTF